MKTKLSDTAKLGLAEFLKGKRQTKNLSLEKLSDLTKIQVYHLKALEEGKFNELPPLVYSAGIFKRLAKFLDVDKDEIIKMYKDEIQPTESRGVKKMTLPKKNFYFVLTPKKLTIFFGGLLLVFLSVYLWYQFKFLVGPPTLVVDPKEDIATKEEIVYLKGKTDSGVELKINGENIYVSSDGNFSKDIQLAAGINMIEITATNQFGKISKLVKQIFKE
jgi:cytoskeletal protein RodZ